MINKCKRNLPQHIHNLIRKIEKAPDFGYDDEECELAEYCNKNNLFYCWNESIFNAEILITEDKEDIEQMRILRGL
jgi:hypothetical protein